MLPPEAGLIVVIDIVSPLDAIVLAVLNVFPPLGPLPEPAI